MSFFDCFTYNIAQISKEVKWKKITNNIRPIDSIFGFCYYVDMIKHINISKSEKAGIACSMEKCDECMELLRALSDKTRQEIIMLFASKKELRVNDVAKNFTLSRPTVSHHLNLMKRSGLLNSRKDGKEVHYSFNKKYVVGLLTSILNSVRKCC